MTRVQKACLAVWMLAFAVGTVTHIRDVLANGWLPRPDAPLAIGIFWKALTLVDPFVVVLLATRRRFGLALGLTVMIIDVLVNSYVWYGQGVPGLAMAIQLQTLFLGFVLGSIAFLWHARA